MEEELVLVDENDQQIGISSKLDVHRIGLLHRAFSIFLWNDNGQMLLQRRAATKYHSAGLWANTCCGHPRPYEDIHDAADRRLFEELGMRAHLTWQGVYSYRAEMPNALIENELVHFFTGYVHQAAVPNPDEVDDLRWVTIDQLLTDFSASPENYSAWFALYITQIPERILIAPRLD